MECDCVISEYAYTIAFEWVRHQDSVADEFGDMLSNFLSVLFFFTELYSCKSAGK